MKKIKIFLLVFILGSTSFRAKCQNSQTGSDDISRIALNAYVPEQAERLSDIANSMLTNKLSQITTQSGMGSNGISNRFILTANANVLTKDITPTAPAMVVLNIELTLYVGDGVEGTKFNSTSVSLQGVGTNETKAYIEAFKNIKPADPRFKSFLADAKKRIIEYYNTKCDLIIKQAESYDGQNDFEAAIYTLTQVPDICKDCYTKALSKITIIYRKQQERDCKIKINEAEAIWSAKPTIEGAEQVSSILIKKHIMILAYYEKFSKESRL